MSMENLPITYKNTFSTYTNLFQWIGLDIFGSKNKMNSSLRLAVFMISFVPFLFSQLYSSTKINSDEFEVGALIIPTALMFCLAFIQMIQVLSKKNELKNLFLEIGELWPKQQDDGESGVAMRSWLRRVGLLKSYYISAVLNATYVTLSPLIVTCYFFFVVGTDEFTLPFPAAWKINSMASFLLTSSWQAPAVLSSMICLYLPFNLLLVIIPGNISMLFRILQFDLENALQCNSSNHRIRDTVNCGPSTSNHITVTEASAEIKRIVIVHQKLLRLIPKLNNVNGSVVLIFVSVSSVYISFSGFRIVVYGGLGVILLNILLALNASFGIFIVAFAGQLLYDSSTGLADAAYNSLWYESDLKVRKQVLLIIVRSLRPCHLTVFGLANLTLPYFTKVISTAWTYFSLLTQLYGN